MKWALCVVRSRKDGDTYIRVLEEVGSDVGLEPGEELLKKVELPNNENDLFQGLARMAYSFGENGTELCELFLTSVHQAR
jgi:hypothetical protein